MKALVAKSANYVVGCEGTLPWRCPEDLSFFRKMTFEQTIVVGRKTFDKLPTLHDRTVMILTRDPSKIGASHVDNVVTSPDMITDNVIVCGGASVYETFLDRITEFYVTTIHEVVVGDVFFNPEWLRDFAVDKEVLKSNHCTITKWIRTYPG